MKPLSPTVRAWRARNSDKVKASFKKWYYAHQEEQKAKGKERSRVLKATIIKEYGGACSCCGDTTFEFLGMDHVGGGGTRLRKIQGGGSNFYIWLRKNGYPKNGYRLLCHNCNMSLGCYGYCPHGESKEQSA